MSFSFGRSLKVQIFGQSHSEMIGCVIDGLPAGIEIDEEKIISFMSRRAPGNDPLSTERKESDIPKIISGLFNSRTCGAPLVALIVNSDHHSSDYEKIKNTPRPNHADYTAYLKYNGYADYRGGGAFSGRMTAPLCFAGAAVMQYLEKFGIKIGAHIAQIGDIIDDTFDMLKVSVSDLSDLSNKRFPVLNDDSCEKMKNLIEKVRNDSDSVGGIIECAVIGMLKGIGEPRYDGIESAVANICFGIPGVKGIEFGLGFGFGSAFGSDVNDSMRYSDDEIIFDSNNCGGICGGISDGRPIIFRCALKPTPSIGSVQNTADIAEKATKEIKISGRHDPCIVPRAIPAVESAAALAVADLILSAKGNSF